MALNNMISEMINTQMESFFSKLNEKYDIEIPEMREIWEGLPSPVIPDEFVNSTAPVKKVPKKAKDPNAPKRPRNAFMFFSADKRPEIKAVEPDLAFGAIGKRLGELWAAEKENKSQEYEKYMRMAEEEKKNGRPVEVAKEKKEAPVKKAPAKKVDSVSESGSEEDTTKVNPPPKKGGCKMAAAKKEYNPLSGMEKCGTVLQTGKNKGQECGKPVKENGMCARHAEMEKKKEGSEEKPAEKIEKKESPAKNTEKKAPVKKTETDPLKGALKNDIEFLDEKLTELDERKIEAIFIQNLDPAKKFNYYTITPISDETYMLQEDFGREIELEEGCENDKEEILKNLTNVDDFYAINKGCDAKKILRVLNGGK